MDLGPADFSGQGASNSKYYSHHCIVAQTIVLRNYHFPFRVRYTLIKDALVSHKTPERSERMEADRIIELNMEEIAPKMLWINVLLLVLFAAAFHFFVQPFSFRPSWSGILYFFVGYAVLIVLHELFHLIGFVIFGKVAISSLKYGVNLKLGIAYATTNMPVRNKSMKKALLLPFWTTAVLPTIAGFWLDSQVLVLLGAMLAAGALGDFWMYRELLKEPNDAWVIDDDELPRLYIYEQYPPMRKGLSQNS